MKPFKTLSIISLAACLFVLGCGESEHSEPQSEQESTETPAQSLSQRALARPNYWNLKIKNDDDVLYTHKVGFYMFETELALIRAEPCHDKTDTTCPIYTEDGEVSTILGLRIDEYHRSPEQDYWHCTYYDFMGPCEKRTDIPWYDRDLITLKPSLTRLDSSLETCQTNSANQTVAGKVLQREFDVYPELHGNIYLQLEVDCGPQKEILDVYLEAGPNRY